MTAMAHTTYGAFASVGAGWPRGRHSDAIGAPA